MAKVLIVYKSGFKQTVYCDTFKVKIVNGVHEVEWSKDANPKPLFIGLHEIESIWKVD